jgi:hypothetical protein
MISEDNVKYVIARKGTCNSNDCDFIRTLAHEFAGEKEVVGYLDLKNALHFESEKGALDILNKQPEWVKGKHVVKPFEEFAFGPYLITK